MVIVSQMRKALVAIIVAVIGAVIGVFGMPVYQKYWGSGCLQTNLDAGKLLQGQNKWKESIKPLKKAVNCDHLDAEAEKSYAQARYLLGFSECMVSVSDSDKQAAIDDFTIVPTTSPEYQKAVQYVNHVQTCPPK
jgi:hypothetical protein